MSGETKRDKQTTHPNKQTNAAQISLSVRHPQSTEKQAGATNTPGRKVLQRMDSWRQFWTKNRHLSMTNKIVNNCLCPQMSIIFHSAYKFHSVHNCTECIQLSTTSTDVQECEKCTQLSTYTNKTYTGTRVPTNVNICL